MRRAARRLVWLGRVATPALTVAVCMAFAPGCQASSDTVHGEAGGSGATGGTGSGHFGSTGAGGNSTGSIGTGGDGGASMGAGGSGGGKLGGVTCDAMGSFCGGHGADGGDPSTLYVCPDQGAQPVSASACSSGCMTNSPPPDACKTMQGGSLTCPGLGLYCGGDQIGGDPGTLYDCTGNGLAPSSSQACTNGCQVNAQGTNDVCKASLVCAGNGDYCGGDEMGGDPDTLYQCSGAGQSPASATPCQNGCTVMMSRQADVCHQGLTCPGSGAYCGADGLQGGDTNTLYQCPGSGQAPSSSQVCSNGCSIQQQGTADYCLSASSCPGGGDYCGGDGIVGATNVLYHCNASGQAPVGSMVCSAGCVVEQQGTADFCASTGMGSCSAVGQGALNWEMNQLNSGYPWSDYCLAFVYNAFVNAGETIGYLQEPTAADSLAAAEATGQFVPWNGSCPCGAILYWAANSCNGEDGHIVICNGDGTVSSSGWPGYNGSPSVSITWLDGQECGNTPSGYIKP